MNRMNPKNQMEKKGIHPLLLAAKWEHAEQVLEFALRVLWRIRIQQQWLFQGEI